MFWQGRVSRKSVLHVDSVKNRVDEGLDIYLKSFDYLDDSNLRMGGSLNFFSEPHVEAKPMGF